MKPLVLADVCLLALLGGQVCLTPPPSWPHLGVAAALVLVSLAPRLARPVAEGGLRGDRCLFLVALLVLSAGLRVQPAGGLVGWWPLVPAGLLLLVGFVLRLRLRAAIKGGELALAVGVTLLACVSVAGAARAVLDLRSTASMSAGRLDFLGSMVLWAAIWFGLDARLRALGQSDSTGLGRRLWDRRHALALAIALGIEVVRAASV